MKLFEHFKKKPAAGPVWTWPPIAPVWPPPPPVWPPPPHSKLTSVSKIFEVGTADAVIFSDSDGRRWLRFLDFPYQFLYGGASFPGRITNVIGQKLWIAVAIGVGFGAPIPFSVTDVVFDD